MVKPEIIPPEVVKAALAALPPPAQESIHLSPDEQASMHSALRKSVKTITQESNDE